MSAEKVEAPIPELDSEEPQPFLPLLWLIRAGTFLYFCFMTLMLLHPRPWSLIGFAPHGGVVRSAFSIVHLLIFTALAIGVELGRRCLPAWVWLILLLLYSPITECLQMLTGRSFEWVDIAQDSAGVLIGMLIAVFIHYKFRWVRRLLPTKR